MKRKALTKLKQEHPRVHSFLKYPYSFLRRLGNRVSYYSYVTRLLLQTGQIRIHESKINGFTIFGDANHRAAAVYASKKQVELLTKEHQIVEKLLPAHPVVFDIGAHIGVRSLMFSRIEGSQVCSFEPVLDTYELLLKNIQYNRRENVKAFQMGFSDRCGTAFFGNPTKNQGQRYRLDDGSDHALRSLYAEKLIKDGTIINGEYADIDTIDNFVAQRGVSRVDAIKIDTEGHDLHVLKGGLETIKRHMPIIQLEVVDYILHLAGLTVGDVIRYVEQLSLYKVYYFTEDSEISEIRGGKHPSAMDILLVPRLDNSGKTQTEF